jgi:hypothetical protein
MCLNLFDGTLKGQKKELSTVVCFNCLHSKHLPVGHTSLFHYWDYRKFENNCSHRVELKADIMSEEDSDELVTC